MFVGGIRIRPCIAVARDGHTESPMGQGKGAPDQAQVALRLALQSGAADPAKQSNDPVATAHCQVTVHRRKRGTGRNTRPLQLPGDLEPGDERR